jgi:pimeloyl-ACP methyl ester carboxylesterase
MKKTVVIAATLALSAALAGTYGNTRSAPVAPNITQLEPRLFQAKARTASPQLLRVGDLNLNPCPDQAGAWCGTFKVLLDWSDADAPEITVGFEYYPSSNTKATRTAVAIEGGPGFSSTGSRNEFLATYTPLRSSHNVLLFDRRGTGVSSVVKCASLQRGGESTPRTAFLKRVRACGKQLDSTYRYRSGPNKGSFVRASGLFGTANAVQDLAATIKALQLGPVDLYGDSYGTYFSQAFTSRFPKLLRSVTLDSGYPVIDQNPWYSTSFETVRDAFTLVCARSLACAASGANGLKDLERLAERLRSKPVSGSFTDPRSGQVVRRTIKIQNLIALSMGAASSSIVYRELNAAARALLERNDSLPLLRLVVEATPENSNPEPYQSFSLGLYVATICTDYPQLFSKTAPEAEREIELEAALRDYPTPGDFAPFIRSEVLAPVMYSCLAWPAALRDDPAITIAPPIAPANVPVMVLSGDLDSTTPPALNRQVLTQMGSSARLINLENTLHVATYGNPSDCGNRLVQAFVRQPEKLATLDASCAKQIPEIRAVGTFVQRSFDAAPAEARAGNKAGPAALKLAAVATSLAGDANFRFNTYFVPAGVSLRGGNWKVLETSTETRVRIAFKDAKWTNDSTVNGTIVKEVSTGMNTANLTIKTIDGVSGKINAVWADGQRQALATLTGIVAGQKLVAQMPAP